MRKLRDLLHREPPPQELPCPRCGVPVPPGQVECTACGWDVRDAYHDALADDDDGSAAGGLAGAPPSR